MMATSVLQNYHAGPARHSSTRSRQQYPLPLRQRNKRHLLRGVASNAAASTQLGDLKRQLVAAAEAGDMQATEECKQILQKIEEAVVSNPPKISEAALVGRFESVLNSTMLLKPGKRTTLGTLTFQQFKPADLEVRVQHVELVQGVDKRGQYTTLAYFEVVEGEYEGLKGVQESMATFSLEGEKPNRQDVTFHGIQIHPTPDTDLSQWLEALKPENPQMGDDGVAEILFPSMLGFRDFLIFDDDLHLSVGNRGSFVVVNRIQ